MKKLILFTSFLVPLASLAAGPACIPHYLGGVAPVIIEKPMAETAREVCFKEFAVMHSGATRTPLWSAERLTTQQIRKSTCLPRKDSFHPEQKLPPDERAELDDYKGSGYDRGHLSPNGDMPEKSAQQESFSLANIIPQAPRVNQRIWAKIEGAVRNEVLRGKELYVVTGPMFEADELLFLKDRVAIPTGIFKAVFYVQENRGAAFIATNNKSDTGYNYDVVSLSELEARIGIKLFPNVAKAIKDKVTELPELDTEKPVVNCSNQG